MDRKSPTTPLTSLALLISVLTPISTVAHPFHSHHTSFTDGLTHGLTSWNHLLIALAIGFLCRIALTNTQFTWGKAMIATTAFYTISHGASLFASVWTAPGLIVGFLSIGLVGVALGHLTIEQSAIQRFRFAGSVVALAVLALTW
jgi:hydrogenase/urease accessory protein HupE